MPPEHLLAKIRQFYTTGFAGSIIERKTQSKTQSNPTRANCSQTAIDRGGPFCTPGQLRATPDIVTSITGWACMAAPLTSLSTHHRDHPPPCARAALKPERKPLQTETGEKKRRKKSNPNQVPTSAATHKCTNLTGLIPLPRAPVLSPLLWSMKPWADTCPS